MKTPKPLTNQQAWNITVVCLFSTGHWIGGCCAFAVSLLYAFGDDIFGGKQ